MCIIQVYPRLTLTFIPSTLTPAGHMCIYKCIYYAMCVSVTTRSFILLFLAFSSPLLAQPSSIIRPPSPLSYAASSVLRLPRAPGVCVLPAIPASPALGIRRCSGQLPLTNPVQTCSMQLSSASALPPRTSRPALPSFFTRHRSSCSLRSPPKHETFCPSTLSVVVRMTSWDMAVPELGSLSSLPDPCRGIVDGSVVA